MLTGFRGFSSQQVPNPSEPLPPYADIKALIEALVGIPQGAIAYATDTDELGTYDGSVWTWIVIGGSATWGAIFGTLADQTDLQGELDGRILHSLATAQYDFLVGNFTGTGFEKADASDVASILVFFLDGIYAQVADGVTNGNSHNHVGGDGAAINYTDVIAAFWNGVTVPAAPSTYYGAPYKTGIDATANQVPWPESGDISDMSIRISTAQPASGSLVITLQVNGVDTTIVVTIAAGSASGTYSDTTHTVTIAATDRLTWKIVNNATAASAAFTSAAMKITKQTT